MKLEIIGAKKLELKIQKKSPQIRLGLIKGINKASAIVEADAKRLSPVRTGNLRESNHMKSAVFRDGEVIGGVTNNCEYAPYVEFGTGVRGTGSYPYETKESLTYDGKHPGQVAQPFLGRALHQNEMRLDKAVLSEVRKALKDF